MQLQKLCSVGPVSNRCEATWTGKIFLDLNRFERMLPVSATMSHQHDPLRAQLPAMVFVCVYFKQLFALWQMQSLGLVIKEENGFYVCIGGTLALFTIIFLIQKAQSCYYLHWGEGEGHL